MTRRRTSKALNRREGTKPDKPRTTIPTRIQGNRRTRNDTRKHNGAYDGTRRHNVFGDGLHPGPRRDEPTHPIPKRRNPKAQT